MIKINCLQKESNIFKDGYIDETDVMSIKPFNEDMMIVTYKDGRADVVRSYISVDSQNLKEN